MSRDRALVAEAPADVPRPGVAQPTSLERTIYAGAAIIAALTAWSPDGVWSFPLGPVPALVFPLAVLLALVAALAAGRASSPLERVADPIVDVPAPPRTRWRRGLAVFLAAGLVLWALRCTVPYGDARAIHGLLVRGVAFAKREPLAPTVFLLVQRSVGALLGWTPWVTLQAVNTVAGALGVVALVALARRIAGPARGPATAAAAVLVGCGAVQLFAGYVEYYTLPTVCMLVSLVCGLDALAGRRGPSAAFAAWTLSSAFHLAGIVFLPAMVWLAYRTVDRRPGRRAGITVLRLLAITVLPVIVLRVLMARIGMDGAEEPGYGGGDGRMFVPLFDLRGMSQYLFLRPRHLAAIANEQLLVAPLGLLAVAAGTIAALRRGRWRAWRTPAPAGLAFDAQMYLGLVATGFLALTVIWNPDLGALRDWDLFGPVGFYLNVCGIALLARHLAASPRRLTALLWVIAIVNLSRALPFVLHNAGL